MFQTELKCTHIRSHKFSSN